MTVVIWTIIVAAVFAVLIILQVYFSRKQSWIPGVVMLVVAALVTRNAIAVLILFAIYLICRCRRKKKLDSLDKMNVQDL